MKKYILLFCFCFTFGLSYAQTTLVNPTAEGGFELGPTFAANGWTVVNGGTNQWYVGAVGVPFAGTRCAYISNTGGATYNYDVNSASVVHFYRDISFPAGEPNIQLSFRWKGQGESGFDYIRVYLVPISVTPVAGTQLTSGQVGGNFNLQGTYQLATFNLPCSAAGTTMRLVFSWRNDASLGTQPPGAIDNIQVTSAPGLPPCNLGAGVINVPALPYSSGAGTTCGQGNDQTASNSVICGSSNYYGGEDVVWVFTPTTSGNVTITLTSSGTWTGLMLYQGCPMNCGICVAFAQSSTGNKTLCASVVAGQTYYLILDSWPSPTCNPYTNLSITAPSSSSVGCNLSYTVSSIPYAPESWTTGTNVPGVTTDDVFSSSYVPINFSFCFDANTYTQCLVSANGYIIFDPPTGACSANMPTGSNATPGGYSGYSITANIPNTDNAPRNAILGPWYDINPASGGAIRYNASGVAPNRTFAVKWDNVPMFGTACSGLVGANQIILYEQNNIIEVHIGNKPNCSWNSNRAICGLHNFNGTIAVVPTVPNRNAIPDWPSTTNEAWRFTPCTPCLNLPLNILNFNGEVRNDRVFLQWYAGEMNAQTLFVERSTDGTTYFPVNDQPYKGSGTYLAVDNHPIPGKAFYRVYAKTKDGGYLYGNAIEIDYLPKHVNTTILAVYPNPAQDELKLDIYFPAQTDGDLEILDMYGKVVKKVNIGSAMGRYSIPVDISNLSNGFYLLRYYDGKRYSETYKIMKN